MDGTDRVECRRQCYYADQGAAFHAELFKQISGEFCRYPDFILAPSPLILALKEARR